MRQDIREGVDWYITNNIEPNFTAMGRQFNCDYRTAKAAYLEVKNRKNEEPLRTKVTRPSILDAYTLKIDEKLALNCSAKSIFKFIKEKAIPVVTAPSSRKQIKCIKQRFVWNTRQAWQLK